MTEGLAAAGTRLDGIRLRLAPVEGSEPSLHAFAAGMLDAITAVLERRALNRTAPRPFRTVPR